MRSRARPELAERLMKPRTVAERLDVSLEMVYRLVRRGKLAHLRVGSHIRIPSGALDGFIASAQTTEPKR
jgi:excisionase family DNA binding protein